jgi:lipopolysaccharide transport system ATP-binding protein
MSGTLEQLATEPERPSASAPSSVLEAEGLSKVYTISHERNVDHNSFREQVVRMARRPVSLVRGQRFDREQFWALDDLSFTLERGDVLGIIGRNGSGKSTLLKILSRIVEPTAGRAVIRGKVASLLEVGTGFHPELTGRENIYFNGSILGMSRAGIRARFDEIVAFSEVERFLDTPVKFYSSGMYVRLAFAVAAHLEPDLLLVDEVLAVGDAAFQQKCLGKMSAVAGEGRTVLFVSHNMSAVKSLCTRAMFMEAGVAKRIGPVDDVVDEYISSAFRPEAALELAARPREGNVTLEARIVAVTLNGEDQDSTTPVDSTAPMTIEMVVEAERSLTREVAIHLVIHDSSGIVLRLHSENAGATFQLQQGTNRICCMVEPTHLLGGNYIVDCSVSYPGGDAHPIDLVLDAFVFIVRDYPNPSGAAPLTQRDAKYHVDHAWRSTPP